MLTVRDIMTTRVVAFDPETPIREAMETLSTSHLSGAPVLSGNRVVGLLSMSDILSFIVSSPEAESDTYAESLTDAWGSNGKSLVDNHTVDEAMNHEVFCVEPSVSARQAAKMMHRRGIHRLLVMHDGKLEGIVSALDIARAVSQGAIRRSGLALDPCAPAQSPWIDLS